MNLAFGTTLNQPMIRNSKLKGINSTASMLAKILTYVSQFFTACKNGVSFISNLFPWVFIFLSWTGIDIFLPQFWSTLSVLTSVNLPELTQTMYESSEFGYERTEYERSMGTTALETNNPFWVIIVKHISMLSIWLFSVLSKSSWWCPKWKLLKWKRFLNFIANLQSINLILYICFF